MNRLANIFRSFAICIAGTLVAAEQTPPEAYQAKQIGTLEGHSAEVRQIEVSRSVRTRVSIDEDDELIVWDVRKRKALYRLKDELPRFNDTCQRNPQDRGPSLSYSAANTPGLLCEIERS